MFTYKCRAECQFDIDTFCQWSKEKNYLIIVENNTSYLVLPDTELTFSSNLDLYQIKKIMYECTEIGKAELHVMYETVQYVLQYTGIRTYSYFNQNI